MKRTHLESLIYGKYLGCAFFPVVIVEIALLALFFGMNRDAPERRQAAEPSPIAELRNASHRAGFVAIGALVAFDAVLLAFLRIQSRRLAGAISSPIERVATLTKNLAEGIEAEPIPPVGIAEMDHLGESFMAMVDGLSRKTAVLEEAVRAADEANREKSEFLENMSHQLRTPMSGILGMIQLAHHAAVDAERKGYLEKAQQSAMRLGGVLDELMDFSKIEAGTLALESVPFYLNSVVGNAVKRIEADAREKGVALNVDLERDVPNALKGDPVRLGQILINLLGTAVAFSHAGGTVDLSVKVMEVGGEDVGLGFSVGGKGIGISPEQRQRLFKAFSQGECTAPRNHGGTGLGLAISHRLVRMMSGEIDVESVPGEGGTFRFTVRMLRQRGSFSDENTLAAIDPKEIAAAKEALSGARVLVVEDDEINRMVTVGLLSMCGIVTEVAENGAEAIAALEGGNFDGVLMDVQMPVMDGHEAARRLRGSKRFRDLPIVALTANVLKGDREAAMAAGMNDYVSKPVDPDRLLIVMARWIKPSIR